jgi:hypothetical protein
VRLRRGFESVNRAADRRNDEIQPPVAVQIVHQHRGEGGLADVDGIGAAAAAVHHVEKAVGRDGQQVLRGAVQQPGGRYGRLQPARARGGDGDEKQVEGE